MDAAHLALMLGIGSALTLAGANTFVKSARDILGGRAVMALSSAVLIAPAAFVVPMPTPETWVFLALSLPAHWIYQTTLVRALTRGDLSLVFPVMRGSAPLITAVAAAIVLGEHLPPLSIIGLLVASSATVVFALPDGAGERKLRNSALLWALATGAAVAVYNVIDAQGVRVAPSPWTFIVWLFMLDWIGINAISFITRRTTYLASMKAALLPGVAAGVCSLASFSMALYGFSLAPVAYISAMRETAVVFAALMGWWFLKEGFGARRTLAALILAAGLCLLQFG